MKLYHCSNLGQIAAMFEDNANQSYEKAAVQRTEKAKLIYQAEGGTWRRAAEILRNTEMH